MSPKMVEPLLRPLVIGDVTLPNNLVLSPMAGFSDLPFRVLARRNGAGLVCSEMVSAVGLEHDATKTRIRMASLAEEAPMSIQVFGTDPEGVAAAAREAAARSAMVGFNMGCPAHQIKRQGCGAALLDRPDLAVELVRAIRGAIRKPVLAKMRAGNMAPMDVVAFARRLEEAGADAIIFHARTAAQGYSGLADWRLVRAVKDTVGIPVIGNGDVVDGPSAARALRESGADGVAIGRASLGDPRVFGRIAHYLETGEEPPPSSAAERLDDFREYLRLAQSAGLELTADFDERDPDNKYRLGAAHVLAQAQQFTKGLAGGARLRSSLNGVRDEAGLVAAFEAHVAWSSARGRVSVMPRTDRTTTPVG